MWRYYWDVTKFNLAFSLVCVPFVGIYQTILIFAVFGTPLGLLGYQYFYKNEYYGYYNLGFTKGRLIRFVWIVNSLLSLPILGFTYLLIQLVALA